MLEAIRMFVLHVAFYAFGTEFAAIERKILPRLKANNLVVLYTELNSALLPAKAAMGFDELLIFASSCPPAIRHAVERRTKDADQFGSINWKLGHLR